jgi:hypothetical protein
MPEQECAICGQSIYNSITCPKCKRDVDMREAWAIGLLNIDRHWRNLLRIDDRNGMKCFTDYATASRFDSISEGYVEVAAMFGETEAEYNARMSGIGPSELWIWWSTKAGLTAGEIAVLQVNLTYYNTTGRSPSSDEGAMILSVSEKRIVKPAAYRRRLSDARRKFRAFLDTRPEPPRHIYQMLDYLDSLD